MLSAAKETVTTPDAGAALVRLAGHPGGLPGVLAEPLLLPFCPEATAFAESLSRALLEADQARQEPDLGALGFWLRRANLDRLRHDFERSRADRWLVARGTALHLAPANVDTLFVYPWILSLLVGNRNVVRLSGRSSSSAARLVELVSATLAGHPAIAARSLLATYPGDEVTTAWLSAHADVRLVWGGDATVARIRQIPLPPTATEACFADKYSLALVGAEGWLALAQSERELLAGRFWQDAYWYGQRACSSPRLVLWIGRSGDCEAAAADFWPRVDAVLVRRGTRFGAAEYVAKLQAAAEIAIAADAQIRTGASNALVRVQLAQARLFEDLHCGAGLFLEARLESLGALRPLLTRKVQTVTHAGLGAGQLRDFSREAPLPGADRFVPFGRALEFGTVWDGFDLWRVLTREIDLS